MSYSYQAHRSYVFTEPGQERFLKALSFAKRAIALAGAVRAQELDSATSNGKVENDTGISWHHMACTDRLVELGYLRELNFGHCFGQDRVFVAGSKSFP